MPSPIKIKPRKIDFEFTDQLPYKWYDGNPATFTLLNVISIMFPVGEQFFIDSVRYYKDNIQNPVLHEDMMGFIAQEALHSKQHELCNKLLKKQHKNLIVFEKIASILLKNLQWLLPARTQLAVSCALEHFTALFSEQLLSKQYFKDYAHPVYAKLWIWHTIEEIEHKAVCYDVYQAVAGGFVGYLERCFVMLCTSLIFLTMIITGFLFISLPNAKKKSKSSTKNRSLITELSFLFFNKDGLIKQIMLPYLAYYAPGFHPWQKNNLPLIEQWKANYENGIFLQIDGTTAPPSKVITLTT